MNGASYCGNSACRSSNQQSNKYYGLTPALPDHLVRETTRSRGELNASFLGIKSGPVRVGLNHRLALCLGTRIGIRSYNRRESGSDWTFNAEIPSLSPTLRFLCARWQAE
jgi:hypothetical protein